MRETKTHRFDIQTDKERHWDQQTPTTQQTHRHREGKRKNIDTNRQRQTGTS